MLSASIKYFILLHSVCVTWNGGAENYMARKVTVALGDVIMVQKGAAKFNSTPSKGAKLKAGELKTIKRNLTSSGTMISASTHRVAWLHIPKCGSSFGTTLAHYANFSLPDEAKIPEKETLDKSQEESIFTKYPIEDYFKNLLWLKGDGNWGNHFGIDEATFKEFKGDFFSLFRHPASRAVSSWRWSGHLKYGVSVTEYARMVEGLATKMVTGQESFDMCQCCCNESIKPNIDAAIQRLRAFRFVGLLEEYDFSVCLFHAMFGGDCLPVEFENMRPGGYKHEKVSQDIATLQGYIDPFDSVLYGKVKHIFQTNLKQYNVTRSSCAKKICPAAAEYFSVAGTSTVFQAHDSDTQAFEYNWPGRFSLDD